MFSSIEFFLDLPLHVLRGRSRAFAIAWLRSRSWYRGQVTPVSRQTPHQWPSSRPTPSVPAVNQPPRTAPVLLEPYAIVFTGDWPLALGLDLNILRTVWPTTFGSAPSQSTCSYRHRHCWPPCLPKQHRVQNSRSLGTSALKWHSPPHHQPHGQPVVVFINARLHQRLEVTPGPSPAANTPLASSPPGVTLAITCANTLIK